MAEARTERPFGEEVPRLLGERQMSLRAVTSHSVV